ncbi:STAS domain-containing protein [Streptomyces roseus]|uniref:STAS domain-containing protein n=1 Tax=Streptomyces roseus TaxID=66430 RepID=UPI003405EA2C
MQAEHPGRSGDIDVEVHGTTTVVRPYGEMDITHAPDFRDVLVAVPSDERRPHAVVVDLQYLTACDSSGLNVLLAASALAADSGQGLSLAPPAPPPAPGGRVLLPLMARGTSRTGFAALIRRGGSVGCGHGHAGGH